MPDEAFNCRQTRVGLLLIVPPFTEVCYCVYTIKNFTSVKLKQNQGKHLSENTGSVSSLYLLEKMENKTNRSNIFWV